MYATLSRYGFDLSNREVAILILVSLLLLAVLLTKKGRPLAFSVVRAFFVPKLALIWLAMSLYVVACVWLLAWLNLWDWSNLKSTLLWWLAVGFTGVFKAQELKDRPHLLGKLVREAFTLSAVVVFIAELVSFPLWVELPMIPAVFFISMLIAVGENNVDDPGIHRVVRFLRGFQVVVGVTIFSFSVLMIAGDIYNIISIKNIREFFMPFLLWIMFIPFIFTISVYMAYEEVFIHLQMKTKQAPIVQYARWRAIFAFGWNIDGVKRLSRDIRSRDIADKQGVKEAIGEIKRLFKAEKNPPLVTSAEGWSPYAARIFLEEYGLDTEDYHRSQWEWCAHRLSVKLSNEVLADRISYYVSGHEFAVTRLRLALDGSNQNDEKQAQRAFDERALTLLAKIFEAGEATAIYSRAQASELEAVVIDGVRIWLEQSNWGDDRLGGYVRNLIIQHPTHRDDN